MILYLSMLLGVALVLSIKLNKAYRMETFTWKMFWKINLFSTISSLIAGLILVINQADMVAILTRISPNSPFLVGGLFSAICGIAGVVILQGLVEMVTKHEKTVIGLNNRK